MREDGDVVGPAWFGVDWGSTRMRAWSVDARGALLGGRVSDDGLRSVRSAGFETVLQDQIGDWLRDAPTAPVLSCGMVGARGGWREAPYAVCPATLADVVAAAETFTAFGRSVTITPGVRRADAAPVADVMRGEELQAFGAAALLSTTDAIVRTPGTHSKWIRLQGGAVAEFKTFATGELFALVRGRSLLGVLAEGDAFDARGFDRGVEHGAREPLSHALFAGRADIVAGRAPANAASAFLSGVLIGSELADSEGDEILIADGEMRRRYMRAAEVLGRRLEPLSAEAATIAGLRAAARLLLDI